MTNLPPDSRSASRDRAAPKTRVYSQEVAGLLLVAVIIFLITLVRYWHNIAWSAR